MTPTLFGLPKSIDAVASALVVEPHLPHLLFVLSTLSGVGFDAIVADTFKDAKASLALTRPTLLITDVRLHEYNGLHLVLRGKATLHDLPAIVTSSIADPVLQAEVEALGATFVELPVARGEFGAAVCRTVFQASSTRQDPVRPPFERRSGERRRIAGFTAIERRRVDRRRDLTSALRSLTA